MSTNRNLRYQTSNTASVVSLKDAHNTFVDNISTINFTNLLKNPMFNRLNSSNVLYDWTVNGVTGTFDSVNDRFTATYGNQGFIEQEFSSASRVQLKPNTIYSAVFYGSASATGMVFEITSTSNYQVYDINDNTKTQSASASIEVSGTTMVKHMLSFRTNATAVSGSIFARIKSIVTAGRTCYLSSICLYEGLVEINGLPQTQLPSQNQTMVASGTPYSTIIFNETGIAVSAAQRAQSADKLYNVGGATETTVDDSTTSTAAIWTSSKVNTVITTHAALTAVGTHGSATINTPNTIVHRDGSGNFTAGTITATLNGNASSSTKILSQRSITDCNAEFSLGVDAFNVKYAFVVPPYSNAPIADYGELITTTDDNSTTAHQEFISLAHGSNNTPRRWIRVTNGVIGGSWSSWVETINTANITSLISGTFTQVPATQIASIYTGDNTYESPWLSYSLGASAVGKKAAIMQVEMGQLGAILADDIRKAEVDAAGYALYNMAKCYRYGTATGNNAGQNQQIITAINPDGTLWLKYIVSGSWNEGHINLWVHGYLG